MKVRLGRTGWKTRQHCDKDKTKSISLRTRESSSAKRWNALTAASDRRPRSVMEHWPSIADGQPTASKVKILALCVPYSLPTLLWLLPMLILQSFFFTALVFFFSGFIYGSSAYSAYRRRTSTCLTITITEFVAVVAEQLLLLKVKGEEVKEKISETQ